MMAGSINYQNTKGISQIGVVGSWPLAERWGLVGAITLIPKDSRASKPNGWLTI